MKKILFYVLMLAVFAVAFACGSREQGKEEKDVIKIGAILPLTGKLSVMGDVEKKAMELASSNVNNNTKVELLFEDGKSTPNGAIQAANKLLNIDKVDVILTSTTGASLAVQPLVVERKVNHIAFCMDPDIASNSEFTIRYYIGINEEAEGITKYFKESGKRGELSVGILYGRVPVWEKVVNQTLVPFFNSNNIKVNYNESYDITQKDFQNLILKLKNSEINHLILLGYGFEYPNIFKPLIEQELLDKLKIIGGWGFLYTQVDSKYLESILVSGPEYVFRNKGKANKFISDYINEYGNYPNFDAAFAYESIVSLAHNFEKKDLSKPLKSILQNGKPFDGVVGAYYFTTEGNMIVNTGLGIIKNGEIIKYEGSGFNK